jgi:hypothetical protein
LRRSSPSLYGSGETFIGHAAGPFRLFVVGRRRPSMREAFGAQDPLPENERQGSSMSCGEPHHRPPRRITEGASDWPIRSRTQSTLPHLVSV